MTTIGRAVLELATDGTQFTAGLVTAEGQLRSLAQTAVRSVGTDLTSAAARATAAMRSLGAAITQTATGALAGLRRASGGAINALSSFATTAAGAAAAMSVVARGNEDLQRQLEGLTVGLILAGAGARTFGGALRFMLSPIGLVVTAIGGLIAAAVQWENISRFVVATTRETWATLGPFFTQLWRGIMLMAEGVATNLHGIFTLDSMMAQAGTTLFEAGLMRLQTAGKMATDGLGAGFTFVMDKVTGLIGKTDDAADAMKALTESLKEWKTFEGVDPFGGFTEARAAAMEAVARHAQELTESLREWKTFEGVDPFGGFESAMAAVPELGTAATITIDGVTRSIKDMAAEQAKFADAFEHNLGELPKKADGLGLSVDSLAHSIASATEEAVVMGKSFGDVATAMLQDIARMILRMLILRAVQAGLSGLAGTGVGNFFGVTAPAAAKGGIVPARPGGTLVQVGEAGEDEAIIPLSRLPSAAGGVEINIINQASGTEVQQRQRTGADGRAIHDFIIAAVKQAAGRGELDSTMGLNFGLARRPGQR